MRKKGKKCATGAKISSTLTNEYTKAPNWWSIFDEIQNQYKLPRLSNDIPQQELQEATPKVEEQPYEPRDPMDILMDRGLVIPPPEQTEKPVNLKRKRNPDVLGDALLGLGILNFFSSGVSRSQGLTAIGS